MPYYEHDISWNTFFLWPSKSSTLTWIFSALLTTSSPLSTRYSTQILSVFSNGDIFSSSSSPSISTTLLAFITMSFLFGHCKATWPKIQITKEFNVTITRSRSNIATFNNGRGIFLLSRVFGLALLILLFPIVFLRF